MAKGSIDDLARALADKHKLSQQEAEKFIIGLFDVLNNGLYSDKQVKIKGLGTFKVIEVKDRESVNVNTGERIVIEGRNKISFTPDSVMKELVNRPFAQFETVVLNDGVDFSDMQDTDNQPEEYEQEVVEDVQEQMADESNANEQKIPVEPAEENTELVTTETANTPEVDVIPETTGIPEISTDSPEASTDTIETPMESSEILTDSEETQNDVLITSEQSERQETLKNVAEEIPEIKQKEERGHLIEDLVQEEPTDNTKEVVIKDKLYDNKTNEEINMPMEEKVEIRNRGVSWLWFFISLIIIGSGTFCLGYIMGEDSRLTMVVMQNSEQKQMESVKPETDKKTITKQEKKATQPKDTTKNVKAVNKTVTTTEKKKEDKEKLPETTPAPSTGNDSPSLSQAHRIVQTGAYRIVGTAETIKVKQGQTLKKISKFYLGDGMECYIQVHNGINEVEEGMSLNIPKLQLKKK